MNFTEGSGSWLQLLGTQLSIFLFLRHTETLPLRWMVMQINYKLFSYRPYD